MALCFGLGLILLCGLALLAALAARGRQSPLAKAPLNDGRIIQIEGVSYGTQHRIGSRPALQSFYYLLPRRIAGWLEPKTPANEIGLEEPGLVVWVNATDAKTGKYVDCQRIKVELIAGNGDAFGEATRNWLGHTAFWRVGHIFYAFPRTGPTLTPRITSLISNGTVEVVIPNPQVTRPVAWSGQTLPQHKAAGSLDVTLANLRLATNSASRQQWETTTRYWLPEWELRQDGRITDGWELSEWLAEDATGNRGQYLGVSQSVLKFTGTFYPRPTNSSQIKVLGRSPAFDATSLQSNVWWNLGLGTTNGGVSVFGAFAKGVYIFLDGVLLTNSPVSLGPVRGGAPSGWVGETRQVSPVKFARYEGHYTPEPVIYVRAKDLGKDERLAVRLKDSSGHSWIAKEETQGNTQGIHPFLLNLPSEATNVIAEFVLLQAVQAEFMVRVPE
jgi:hypothetical protein